MAIITISRGSYYRGREVAEKLAAQLGYECISREIILEASKEFNIPEIKLVRAIQDAPTILERFIHDKEKYLTYIRAALLKHVQKDNVVYHGLFGNFFLQDIPHVLKVRIVGDLESRVADEVKREGIPADKAREHSCPVRMIMNGESGRFTFMELILGTRPSTTWSYT